MACLQAFFASLDIRKAFAYSFDFKAYITQVLLGKAEQPTGPVVNGLFGYNPMLPKYSYNPDVAAKFFKAAFGGQVWDKGFKITLVYNSGNNSRKTAMDILKKDIETLNPKFHLTVRGIQWADYIRLMNTSKLPVWAGGWIADYADPYDFIQPFFASDGFYASHISYDNPKMNKLVDESATLSNGPQRQDVINQIQHLGYSDVPYIFTSQPLAAVVARSWIKGHYNNAMWGASMFYYYPMYK